MQKLPARIFSHHFSGTIWNTLSFEPGNLLFIEVRDDVNFTVQFSLLDYERDKFIWRDVRLTETWWISMTAANADTLLFQRYINKGNPDHKSLIAFDNATAIVRWEVPEFSFFDWNETEVTGYSTHADLVPATISLESGKLTEGQWEVIPKPDGVTAARPVLYAEGTVHFETVKKFILQNADYAVAKAVEYLEYNAWILVSIYIENNGSLANYLLVFDAEGKLALDVPLGEKLGGLGTDTFFILSGCLFLVQNKTELVAYRL